MVFGCFACMAAKLRFGLVQARLRHILDLCLYIGRGAFYLFSQGVATYWGSFLVLRGFQRCRFRPAECTVFCCGGARI